MLDEVKTAKPEDCLAGGGEMGALMRSLDWSKTLLGSVSSWPQSLRTAVSIILASRFPMLIHWRLEYVQFYLEKLRVHLGLEWVYEKDEVGRMKDENSSLDTSSYATHRFANTRQTSIVAPPVEESAALLDLAMRGDLRGIVEQAARLEAWISNGCRLPPIYVN